MALKLSLHFKIFVIMAVASTVKSSSSSGSTEVNKEICGNSKFYCPKKSSYTCYNRTQRCVNAGVCLSSDGAELNCKPVPGSKTRFEAHAGLRPLQLGTSSSRKRRFASIAPKGYTKHGFVTYRGFVYETGSDGKRELDYNDPDYYNKKISDYVESDCTVESSCSRDQVLDFMKKWPEYHLTEYNCQHFSEQLMAHLENNCNNRAKRSAEKYKCPCSLKNISTDSKSVRFEFGVILFFSYLAKLLVVM